ncbi:c-type cytochrome [Duganella sp. sic0402]|uniref:c-type cytochrome n=1 Tax=Duganella sp. sic0402 TaxID=2854786 RepID=UPI001C492ECB|nr:c-type cytochrome [Duganella sp. sic0402]MBV7539254.1 c-type cytochrome [Duganella sp. sic0402]
MKLTAFGLLAAIHLACAAEPQATSPAIPPAARLAATCAACHGTAGHTQGNTLPALAGQSQQALSASLHAFKTGKRESTIMTQIAKGYSDEQIELLAAYFAAQQKEAK